MKSFAAKVLALVAVVGVFSFGPAFAATKNDAKVKQANKNHSSAPVTEPEGSAPAGPSGATATGQGLQGLPSPEMTKWTVQMKACHKGGTTDQACHDRVMKGCEEKLKKEECAKIMTQVNMDNGSKM